MAVDGRQLDGNSDGVVGDNYVSTFTIEPLPVGFAIVGVPGFFETAGQELMFRPLLQVVFQSL